MNPLRSNSAVERAFEVIDHGRLACEDSLRVAAATVSRAPTSGVSATRVIGVIGADDLDQFHALVAAISDEYDVDAQVRLNVGSFAVRFTRRMSPQASADLAPTMAARRR